MPIKPTCIFEDAPTNYYNYHDDEDNRFVQSLIERSRTNRTELENRTKAAIEAGNAILYQFSIAAQLNTGTSTTVSTQEALITVDKNPPNSSVTSRCK
jgi:hypothetical protein